MCEQACLDKESCPGPLTPRQSELLYLFSHYYDLYYPGRTMENQEEIRMVRTFAFLLCKMIIICEYNDHISYLF